MVGKRAAISSHLLLWLASIVAQSFSRGAKAVRWVGWRLLQLPELVPEVEGAEALAAIAQLGTSVDRQVTPITWTTATTRSTRDKEANKPARSRAVVGLKECREARITVGSGWQFVG